MEEHNNQDIGYKKPPKKSQFKKGASGNPKGRPKGSTHPDQILSKFLDERVTIREGNNFKEVTKLEAIIMQRINKAMKGGYKESNAIINSAKMLNKKTDKTEIIIRHISPDGTTRTYGDDNET